MPYGTRGRRHLLRPFIMDLKVRARKAGSILALGTYHDSLECNEGLRGNLTHHNIGSGRVVLLESALPFSVEFVAAVTAKQREMPWRSVAHFAGRLPDAVVYHRA